MAKAALSYSEPSIVTVLIQASFLLLLNLINWVLDNAIYCGLVGQVLVGVAWGTPGAQWLSREAQETVMQLGYLGLVLIVYEGGLSTSYRALWSNLPLSGTVALIGVATPIGLSFILQRLLDATAVQAFAAGAALCSTSLGTTFTILSTSGLDKSRLGVVLSSAAMLDDVAGLVMVQVISNLGTSAGSHFSAITVIRPVFVSVAFGVIVPAVCVLVSRPLTKAVLGNSKLGQGSRIFDMLSTANAALVIHSLVLIGMVTGSSYAGTSNLLAAYIAGAVISWWDGFAKDIRPQRSRESGKSMVSETSTASACNGTWAAAEVVDKEQADKSTSSLQCPRDDERSGVATYERFYARAVNLILKPFFFASIGFAIPITQMFRGAIFWRGMIYTLLMVTGKLVCGVVFIRPSGLSRVVHLITERSRSHGQTNLQETSDAARSRSPTQRSPAVTTPDGHGDGSLTIHGSSKGEQDQRGAVAADVSRKRTSSLCMPKPQSLYPAAMLGSAMVARGEIGFLISSLAESTGVFGNSVDDSSEIFLVVTWAILLCTVIGPISIGIMARRVRRLQEQERSLRTGRADPLGIWGVT